LARGLRDRGHQVHVVTATPGASAGDAKAGVTIHSVRAQIPERWRAYRSLYNPPAVREFRRILERVQPDVVNAHNVHVHLSYGCISAAARMRIPVVFTAQDTMSVVYGKLQHYVIRSNCPPLLPEIYRLPFGHNLRQARLRFNPIRNTWIRHTLRSHVRARVAVSQALRLALEANGLPPFRVVHNGAAGDDLVVAEDYVAAFRERIGLRDRRVILLAGRISEAKGSMQALAALARVVDAVPNSVLLVLSPQEIQLGEYAPLREAHVRFAGWLSGADLAAAYAVAGVVVMPSVYLDACPLVNLEAMAARKPVIATCHGGSPEIVQDGVTGYIVNPFDTAQFAGRLVDVLSDEGLQARLGNAGYERYLKEFTQERFAERMSAIFDEVTA
jgi:glycosyltransferase involved in cell wall biosynthesis